MVDPDNRRPVDFAMRQSALADDQPTSELTTTCRDGRIKQRVIERLLALRRRLPDLFGFGSYEPVEMAAPFCVFERRHGGHRLVVAVHLRPWSSQPPDEGPKEITYGLSPLFETGMLSSLPFGVWYSTP